ncbi:Ig-like domain-containing protein [Alistipes provencensis]|uniref:Ig-like domain-containing protein n=1 Tax=Alistipes provencensis TaxID=1816676 RepID=UPI0007EE1940|nr:Ig-like domain-containing protein [Alistipes provencensis]
MKKLILLSLAALALTACGDSDWLGDGNVYYKPKELTLSKSSLSELIIGETRRLYASFDPAETTDGEISWSSSNDAVATVDENGAVRATGLGDAVITARSTAYPEIEATCAVSVTVEAGIRVYDLLLNEPVDGRITFVRNSTGNRDYFFEIFVHDTFDKSVTFETTNGEVVDVEEKELDGRTGFTLVPGQELGDATITIQSTRNDDVRAEIPVSLKTIKVTGVALSLNEDGSEASDALAGSLTVSHTKAIRVVFSTDDEEIKIPENSLVHVESSNTAVATVDAEGTQDPATQTVSFNVYMIDDPANAPAGNSTITVKEDFAFDPANCEATEILITATSDDASAAAASCKLRPYQYVPATGVMVTDQWGNRMRGTSSTNSTISSPNDNYACIVYCSGGGTAKKTQFNDTQSWAVASPAVDGIDKVGSVAIYLTATPYPYEYPTIADPDQPFYWACLSTSRFAIAGAGYEEGNQSEGWAACKKDDGKIKCFLGHTCKFWTGHKTTTKDAPFIRIWRYTEGQANDGNYNKTDDLLFRFLVNTSQGSGDSKLGIPSLKNDDGTARVFDFLNTGGITQPFDDPCPVPWTGPMPRPVGYYTLDDSGAPAQLKTWGDIPVPTKLTEIK